MQICLLPLRRWRRLLLCALPLVLAAVLALITTQRVHAASFDIACTGGVGDGAALLAAMEIANSNRQDDTIHLAANCVYQLPNTLYIGKDGPDLQSESGHRLIIHGNGATLRGGLGDNRGLMTIADMAVVTINHVTIRDGVGGRSFYAAAGIDNAGDLTVNHSAILDNMSGERFPNDGNSPFAIVNRSNFAALRAKFTLNNSTISGGGRIFNGQDMILNNSTVNVPGGIFQNGLLNLNNSILNRCAGGAVGTQAVVNYSLIQEVAGCLLNQGDGAIVNQNPGLLPLTGNPAYHPLMPNSPAINAGSNALVPSGITTDQAGNPRFNGTVDMGAVEYQGAPREVTVWASHSAIEEGQSTTLTFQRTAPYDDEMVVNFTVGGSASASDWEIRNAAGQRVNQQIIIPAGATSTTASLLAVEDLIAEAGETVVVTIVGTLAYRPAFVHETTVNILANDYLVTKLTDYDIHNATAAEQEGTLRRALANANSSPTDDTIVFQDVAGTITLVSGSLAIANNGSLTLEAAGIVIDGNTMVTPLRVDSGATVVINGLTVTRGKGINGGIFNQGNLTLNHVVVTGNSTETGIGEYYGGGISNSGTLTLNRSVVSNNVAQNGGGGISNGGTLRLNSSSVVNNQAGQSGGGIGGGYIGDITLVNSTVSGNRVTGAASGGGPIDGGGIFNGSALTLINSTVSSNTSALTVGASATRGP